MNVCVLKIALVTAFYVYQKILDSTEAYFYTKKRKYYGEIGQILGYMLPSKSNAEKK